MCKLIFLIIFRISIFLFFKGFCLLEVVELNFFFWLVFFGGCEELWNELFDVFKKEFDKFCWEVELLCEELVWVFDMILCLLCLFGMLIRLDYENFKKEKYN